MRVFKVRFTTEPMFPAKKLAMLIVPLVVEQLLAVTIGMADTMMVSSVGMAATSAVSLVDSINILLIQIFSALATGGAVVASQYIGRQEKDKACEAAKQLVLSIFVLASVIMLVSIALNRPILRLVFGNIEEEVMSNAEIYFLLSAISYPFLAVYNAGAAIYRAMGNSKVSMSVSFIMNVINISGNAILIYVFDMGVMGAALASLIARAVSAIVMLILVSRKSQEIHIENFKPKFNLKMIKKILNIGVPSGLENGLFQIGKLVVSSLISTMGTAVIAANAISNTVASMATIPCSAVGIALITVVGQCMGANEKEQAKYYTDKLLVLAYATLVPICLLMLFLAAPIVSIFNMTDGADLIAVRVIEEFTIASIVIWPIAFVLPNALRAAGDARFTMFISIASMAVFRIGFCYLFVQAFNMGIYGVWYAMYVDWAVRTLLFTIRYLRGKWQNHKVI